MMDLRALSSVTDYFLVATALSRPQLAAMAGAVQDALAKSGGRVEHVEGLTPPRRPPKRLPVESSEEDGFAWVLLDCGSVIVHLLNPPARQFYQLEHLWGDAPRVQVE